MPAVRTRGLYKIFGRRAAKAAQLLDEDAPSEEVRATGATPAVIDVSLDVQPGEIFVVMGLSGSGKSTLIRMLNGLLEPTAGHVEIDGTNITTLGGKELREIRQRKISMVFQHFALFPHRTVRENAAYALEVQGVPKEERYRRAEESLELVGLDGWGGSYPGQLSGGMKQRVGLARALAAQTDIMLMDEAFSALDPLIRKEMQDQLIELQHRLQKAVVFITHDLNEAMRLGDRIAMLRNGRVVQIGTAEEILNDPANDYVATFVQDVDRSRVLTAGSVMVDPIAFARDGDGPRVAHRLMREHVLAGLYVVGPGHRLIGAVTDDQLTESVRDNDRRTLGELAATDITTVHRNTAVVELFEPAAEAKLPLAVVDDDNRLLGVISRATLLAALGSSAAQAHQEEQQPGGGHEISGTAEQPGSSMPHEPPIEGARPAGREA